MLVFNIVILIILFSFRRNIPTYPPTYLPKEAPLIKKYVRTNEELFINERISEDIMKRSRLKINF